VARDDVLDSLVEIAGEQGGYVAAGQAARLGIERSRLARLTESGDLRRVRWGVYAMRHAHHRLEAEIGAWLSVDRERLPWERNDVAVAVLSHATAAAIRELGTVIPGVPVVTVPPERRSATRGKDIELHVASLAPEDWNWVRVEDIQLPVTSAARTIVDLTLAGEELSYVERAIAEAVAREGMTETELIDAAARRKSRTAGLVARLRRLSQDLTP
jgi:predicted transcriptional regulator of viral defense system